MASTDLRKELECSVCLSIYRDPVTLKCGHNFCQGCIDRVLNSQRKSGIYSCPDCREEFQERPALHRNITLRNIVENFQSAHPNHEETVIFCSYCYHSPVPAVKSCLHCEASLCDNHLKVHSRSPEHVLCDPTTSPETRKCPVHKEPLKYFCIEDFSCICVSCSLVGDHWGHQMEALDEASEMKKESLRNVLQKLTTKREAMEKRVQNLHEHRRRVHGKANVEKDRVSTNIRDLRRRLKVLEKKVVNEISSQTERLSQSLLRLIRQLDAKKEEFSRTMCHIKKLCNTTDPVTVLQEPDADLYDTEDGEDEFRERYNTLLHGGGDLDMASISHTLHTGIAEILSTANVQKWPSTHVYPRPNTKGKAYVNAELPKPQPAHNAEPPRPHPQPAHNAEPPRPQPVHNAEPPRPHPQPTHHTEPPRQQPQAAHNPEPPRPNSQQAPNAEPPKPQPQPTPTVKHSYRQARAPNIRAVQPKSEELKVADVLLDESTAGNRLHISEDGKTASWSDHSLNHPESEGRFQVYPQVLSRQSFSSGRHYWEVDVGGSGDWIVGVSYPSIDKRGGQSLIGGSEKAWGLERWGWDKQYLVIHDRDKIQLPGDLLINRVRIELDYEAGRISFYDVCDQIQHLHTFTTTFTEPLHAGFYVGDGSIKICGGNSM